MSNSGEGAEKLNHSCVAGKNAKLYGHQATGEIEFFCFLK